MCLPESPLDRHMPVLLVNFVNFRTVLVKEEEEEEKSHRYRIPAEMSTLCELLEILCTLGSKQNRSGVD